MVVPLGSSMNTVLAKDNTNQIGHPFLSVVAAWTDINSDDLAYQSSLCLNGQGDDDDCFDGGSTTIPCDFRRHFSSLEALQAASSNIPSACLDGYSLQVVSDMLNDALINYTSVDNGYDGVWKYYTESVKAMIPYQVSEFMKNGGVGNQFFDCIVSEGHGKNQTPRACPFMDDFQETWDVYYIPKNISGFWVTLEATYGINQSVSSCSPLVTSLLQTHVLLLRLLIILQVDSTW